MFGEGLFLCYYACIFPIFESKTMKRFVLILIILFSASFSLVSAIQVRPAVAAEKESSFGA